jgi:hypothetical protein
MELEKSFCLFHGDAGPMAVSVESVYAILDTEFLVPLVWSPPQVAVPVFSLGPIGSGAGADRTGGVDSRPAAGTVASAAKNGGEENSRCVVLILRTEHDPWGLRIDHPGTFISRACPDFHAPRLDEHGSTLIGILLREGTRYSILDAEATWRGLRSAVARWYGLINEPSFYTALPAGEKTRAAGTGKPG